MNLPSFVLWVYWLERKPRVAPWVMAASSKAVGHRELLHRPSSKKGRKTLEDPVTVPRPLPHSLSTFQLEAQQEPTKALGQFLASVRVLLTRACSRNSPIPTRPRLKALLVAPPRVWLAWQVSVPVWLSHLFAVLCLGPKERPCVEPVGST